MSSQMLLILVIPFKLDFTGHSLQLYGAKGSACPAPFAISAQLPARSSHLRALTRTTPFSLESLPPQ